MAAAGIVISSKLSSDELRRLARVEVNRRADLRMLAIANALDGLARAEAARFAGMSGQGLCDAIKRYTAEGLEGLYDRPKPGRPRRLSARQEEELGAMVMAGADVEKEGISAYTREDLTGIVRKKWPFVLPCWIDGPGAATTWLLAPESANPATRAKTRPP